jgi:hypothetical protein
MNARLFQPGILIVVSIIAFFIWGRTSDGQLNAFGILVAAIWSGMIGRYFLFHARSICAQRAASAKRMPRLFRIIFPPESFDSLGERLMFRLGGVLFLGVSVFLLTLAIQRMFSPLST